jgi:hypothetical protein
MDEKTWLLIAAAAVLIFLVPFLGRLLAALASIGTILVATFLYFTNPTLLDFNDFLRQTFISTKDPSLVAISGLISKVGTEATTRENYYLASVYTIDLSLLTLFSPEIPTSVKFLGIANQFFRVPTAQEMDDAWKEGNKSDTQQATASVGVQSSASAPTIRQVRVIAADELNVRSGPGVNYPVVGKVFSGNVVKNYAEQNGWTQIDSGWVRSRFVTEAD